MSERVEVVIETGSRGRSFCICPLVSGTDSWKTGGQTRKDRPFVPCLCALLSSRPGIILDGLYLLILTTGC